MRRLLQQPNFLAYFSTQFLGALNDNFFKNALTLSIIYQAQQTTQQNSLLLINIAAAVFILPFLLFSPVAGYVAQISEKSHYIQRVKLIEIFLMCIAAALFMLNQTIALIGLLFLMGSQSTFFGPVKYSILPLMLNKQMLYQANALVEAATFIAILIGLFLSSFLAQSEHADQYFSIALISFALLGYASSRRITKIDETITPRNTCSWNIVAAFWQQIRLVQQQQLTRIVTAISFFWFFGATYLTQLPAYVKFHLQASTEVYSLLLILFSIGIGLGSLASRWFTRSMSLIQISRLGLMGLILFGIILSLMSPIAAPKLITLSVFLNHSQVLWLCLSIISIGISGGFFIVPLYTLLQLQSNDDNRSHIIAANNVVNALFMIFSAIFAIVLLQWLNIAQLFFVLSCSSFAAFFLLKPIAQHD